MTENSESSQYWPHIPHDFSRYVCVFTKSAEIVLQNIYQGAPYHCFDSSGEKGSKWIVIKYPNKTVALREAIKLRNLRTAENNVCVDFVSHELAVLARLENRCVQYIGQRTTASITNFPERISEEQWLRLLSKFSEGVTVNKSLTDENGSVLNVTCETLVEAEAITLALHNHEVDGKKLSVRLYNKEKEKHLINLFRNNYEICPCLVRKCSLHPPEPSRKTANGEGTSAKKQKPQSPLIICSFCRYPGSHPSSKDFVEKDANTRDVPWSEEFANTRDVPWSEEFAELEENRQERNEAGCSGMHLKRRKRTKRK